MMNKYFYNNSNNYGGIYRAMLIDSNGQLRIYVPGLHSNNLDKNNLEKYVNILPEPIWNVPNLEAQKHEVPTHPCWVTFENGDSRRPIIMGWLGKGIMYSVNDSSSSSEGSNTSGGNNYSTGTYNPSGEAPTITIDGGAKYYNSLIRCMNGTDAGYVRDEGLDVSAPIGTPVYSPCNGTIRYSEYGHTPWGQTKFGSKRDDTPWSIGIDMSNSVQYAGKTISYVFLTHLSRLVYDVPSGSGGRPVKAGELIAYSGTANDSPHLHIGLSPSSWNPLTMQQTRDFFNSKLGEQWVVGN